MKLPSELNDILRIRQLRVNSRRRRLGQADRNLQIAQQKVGATQQKLTMLGESNLTLHREGLQQLVGGIFSGMDAIHQFNAQTRNRKATYQKAFEELRSLAEASAISFDAQKAAKQELLLAEKKLIGFEEMIAEQPWK